MNQPHGNHLVRRFITEQEKNSILSNEQGYQSIPIDDELVKDVKNICRGVFSPIDGFVNSEDLESILMSSRLKKGTVWPIPLLLSIDRGVAERIHGNDRVMLRDQLNQPIAMMTIEEKYEYNPETIAEKIFGTRDPKHPGVSETLNHKPVFLAGPVDLLDDSKEPFGPFNLDPVETRILFAEKGFETVTGFQTRNPSHRGHEYLQRCSLEITDGLFINPVIGKKKEGDFKDEVILAAYCALVQRYFPKSRVVLSILPLRMRYAGPKEAIFHAIIRKNFGCTHFVVGRDHAGVGSFYGPFDAQRIFETIPDLGITILKFDNSFFCRVCDGIATSKTCGHRDEHRVYPSGTDIRKLLLARKSVPRELMRKDIVDAILSFDHPFIPKESEPAYAK